MKYITISLLALAVIFLGFVAFGDKEESFGRMVNSYTTYDDADDHTYSWVSTVASQILEANPQRNFMRITIDGNSTNTLYVWQATSTDLVKHGEGGIELEASSTRYYQIDNTNPYIGPVQVVASGDTKFYLIEQ